MLVVYFDHRLWAHKAVGPQSFLIVFPVLPVILLNSSDPLGIRMRPLAEILLLWDRRPAAVEGAPANHCYLPLKHSCLCAVESKCKTKTPFVLGHVDVYAVSLVGTTVQQYGGFLCLQTE